MKFGEQKEPTFIDPEKAIDKASLMRAHMNISLTHNRKMVKPNNTVKGLAEAEGLFNYADITSKDYTEALAAIEELERLAELPEQSKQERFPKIKNKLPEKIVTILNRLGVFDTNSSALAFTKLAKDKLTELRKRAQEYVRKSSPYDRMKLKSEIFDEKESDAIVAENIALLPTIMDISKRTITGNTAQMFGHTVSVFACHGVVDIENGRIYMISNYEEAEALKMSAPEKLVFVDFDLGYTGLNNIGTPSNKVFIGNVNFIIRDELRETEVSGDLDFIPKSDYVPESEQAEGFKVHKRPAQLSEFAKKVVLTTVERWNNIEQVI